MLRRRKRAHRGVASSAPRLACAMHSTVHLLARFVQRKVTPYATHGNQKRARDVWPDSMTALRPAERPGEVQAPCLHELADRRNLLTTDGGSRLLRRAGSRLLHLRHPLLDPQAVSQAQTRRSSADRCNARRPCGCPRHSYKTVFAPTKMAARRKWEQ